MPSLPPPEDDGLEIPEVGDWSRDKHHFLRRYIDAFTKAMKGKWNSLHYIDLFAGAGIERVKSTGELDWGSPLIAAQAAVPFAQLHLCETDRNKHRALTARIERLQLNAKPQILHGDANSLVSDVIDKIPPRSLSLAFLDPYGLHLHFATVCELAKRRVDLIIFFPDHLDALRNWEKVYSQQPDSNMDRFMGKGVDWLGAIEQAPKGKWAEVLRTLYCDQLRGLGYKHFDAERIMSNGRPLYLLIFCARHKLAVDLWRGVGKIKRDGQYTFEFE